MSNHTAANRQSTRLSLSLPIVIHGRDAQQKAFRERTLTLVINKHGAKLLTSLQLVIGAEILIENPTLGNVAKANVVWVSAKRDPSGLHEAGVQLAESQNIWGIEFPPDDWTAKGKVQGASAAKESPAPRPAPVESVPAKTPPPTLTREEITTQILQELRETADVQARQFRERLDQLVQRIGLELEIDLRERAGAAKKQEVAAIEQQILAFSEHLSALKAEMEALEARLAQSQESLGAVLDRIPPPLTPEQIHEKIEAEALPLLHLITASGIADAREHIQAQLQADADQALAAWRSNLYSERDSRLEEARQQIVKAVTAALETLHRERDAGLKEMKRHIQEEIQENKERVVLQIKSKLDETAASHGESLQARLQDIVNKTVASSSDQIRAQVEESANAAAEKSLQVEQANLQEFADHIAASSSEQVQGQINEALSLLGAKSQEMQERAVNEALEAFRGRLSEFLGLLHTGGNK
jgi:hypothetical protein